MTESSSARQDDPVISAFVSDVRLFLSRDFPEAMTWASEFIHRCADIAVNKLNRHNPRNPLTLQLRTVPDEYRNCVVIGAAAECLVAKKRDLKATDRSPQFYDATRNFWQDQYGELAGLITQVRPASSGLRGRRG